MEERQPKTNAAASRAKKPAKPARSPDRRRQRAEELLAAQREQLDQVEVEIESQLDEVVRTLADTMGSEIRATREQLAAQSKALASQAHDLDQRWEDLAAREQKLVALGNDLTRRETQLATSQCETAERQQQLLAQQQQAAEQARRRLEELAQRRAEVEAAAAQLYQSQLATARAREEQQLEAEQWERRRDRMAELERRLTLQEEELERRREQTKGQRRRIAGELKAERAAQQHEFDELRRTIEQLQVSHRTAVAHATAQLEQQRQDLDEQLQSRARELTEQGQQLAADRQSLCASQQALEQQAAALDEARRQWEVERQESEAGRDGEAARLTGEVERLASALAAAQASAEHSAQQSLAAEQLVADLHAAQDQLWRTSKDDQVAHELLKHDHADLQQSLGLLQADHERLHAEHTQLGQEHESLERRATAAVEYRAVEAAAPPEWQSEREALIGRLADAEQQLSTAGPQRLEDLQRRFELAVDDVRSLKRRNSELEEQLLALQSGGQRTQPVAAVADSDWASVKRQLLESLEADSPLAGAEERLSIESTVQITDEIISHKDSEIAELKLLLSQQSRNLGSLAVGASAIAGTLERDELIVQERERLRKLQEEWREKMRQAEIDVSVERARIARQRAEIEEKLAVYAAEKARQPKEPSATGGSAPAADKKPVRGRWLSRLGLKDGTE